MSKSSAKPRRNPENAFQSIGDEGGLVVVPEHSRVQVLNPVGSTIFAMLDGQHTEEQIIRAVVEQFDVTEDVARRDLLEFLEELNGEELLAAGAGSEAAGE